MKGCRTRSTLPNRTPRRSPQGSGQPLLPVLSRRRKLLSGYEDRVGCTSGLTLQLWGYNRTWHSMSQPRMQGSFLGGWCSPHGDGHWTGTIWPQKCPLSGPPGPKSAPIWALNPRFGPSRGHFSNKTRKRVPNCGAVQ
eukprot:scaffold2879_cov269-Prasinococcus_capsulatus_cf.AAC.14